MRSIHAMLSLYVTQMSRRRLGMWSRNLWISSLRGNRTWSRRNCWTIRLLWEGV